MSDIPKLDLKSQDIAADKIQQLKQLFPEVFTEGDQIDFEKLKLTLGETIDTKDERFGLHWAGKKNCFKVIQEPSIGTLKPAPDESVNWKDSQNLFIEGDNLEVLKLLQKSYYGKVKMIYIDPPYNTGKEFIYPDNYKENIDTYLAYSGQVNHEGYKFSTNTETEGRYHSKWLNMMYPRLFLARNLLREDGVIFISIDDNESHNLKKICDDIYGEENFVANIVWEKKFAPSNDAKWFSDNHDHVLLYAKNKMSWSPNLLERDKRALSRYKNPDGDKRGVWVSGDMTVKTYNANYDYKIITPSGKSISPPDGICWRFSKEKVEELRKDNRIWFGKEGSNVPRIKRFLSEVKDGITPLTIWYHKDVGHNQEAFQECRKLFEGKQFFSTPKPTRLISRFLHVGSKEDSLIMDFFSGSSSSAHSVLDLNKTKGTNRKYIMVQLPEPTEEKSEAYKAGYKTIADIGKERIRRVIKKIKAERDDCIQQIKTKQLALAELEAEKAKSPELFKKSKGKNIQKLEDSIKELQERIEKIDATDLGFKVFKLDKSNFKIWDGTVADGIEQQLEMAIDHINPNSSESDILYELLLKSGFELTEPVQEISLAGKKVYSIAEDALLICLEKELTEDLIRAIAAKQPARVVCLDTGFQNNDQLKTNAVQIMKSHEVHDFRTV